MECTGTDLKYTGIRPSVDTKHVKPEVHIRDTNVIGSNDANAMNVSAIHTGVIVKDMTAMNAYVSLKDTDVLDPLKDPDALVSAAYSSRMYP
jgi:hypothetical protein